MSCYLAIFFDLICPYLVHSLYFIPSPHFILHVVCVLYPVHIFQSVFYTYPVFYNQSVVRSLQSMFYTDRNAISLQKVYLLDFQQFNHFKY